MDTLKTVLDSKTIMTEMIMPNDTNPLGNLMGGNLMRWMDIAAAICANRHAEAHCVTVSVDHLSFYKSIKLGQVITVESRITRAFNTSMEVFVQVFSSDSRKKESELSNHAFFSFVALQETTLKPVKVPQIIPINAEEEHLFNTAMARRELRLMLSGRLEAKNAKVLKEILDGKSFFF